MLIKYTNILTVKCLKNIAKIYNIKYISNLGKSAILDIINRYKSCSIIQRYFRNKLITDVCPISHEKIKYPMICIRVNKKFIYYDFETFVKYINSKEDQIDPCTRTVISDKKINEINKLIKYYYGKNTNKTVISKNMLKNTELNIIIYCLYDLISEITILDYITIDSIYNIILPRFIYYIHKLIKNHPSNVCLTIINACKQSLFEIINKDNVVLILDYLDLILVLNYTS